MIKPAQNVSRCAALFLDRDGVINRDTGYVHTTENFVFNDGIFEIAAAARAAAMPVVVVTNQSGIGRGYYTTENFDALTSWMCAAFETRGTPIAAVYHCPYHQDAIISEFRFADHPLRKPNPGMLLAARDDLGLDLTRSVMIGDRRSDLQAAARAGLACAIMVGEAESPDNDWNQNTITDTAIRWCRTVADAAAIIPEVLTSAQK